MIRQLQHIRWASLTLVLLYMVCSSGPTVFADTDTRTQTDIYHQNILYYDINSCDVTSSTAAGTGGKGGSGSLASNYPNAGPVFDYLVSNGLSKVAAAGLVGNFTVESGLNPKSTNGSHNGLAQWDVGVRWPNLLKFAQSHGGEDPYALTTQEAFVVYELSTDYKSTVLDPLEHQATTPKQAADIVFNHYEIAGDSSGPAREGYAQEAYNEFANGVSGPDTGGNISSASGAPSCGPGTTTGTPNFIDLTGGAAMPAHGKLSTINALVIHYTEGNTEGNDLKQFFISQGLGYGIQFNIGATGKVYEFFPLNNMQETWHVGDINGHSIGIEITAPDGRALLDPNHRAQFNSVVSTVQFLCNYYKISCSNPIGDITGNHNDPEKAQGLLGHSEAPNPVCGDTCNHSDPDTEINNGQIVNITTGKVWTDADRCNASIHAYMMKLRTTLGYNATPGINKACTW